MITTLFIAAAAAVLFWPSKQPAPGLDFFAPGQAEKPDYLAAVAALQTVSQRLDATEELDQPSTDAINILMLGLVAGANK